MTADQFRLFLNAANRTVDAVEGLAKAAQRVADVAEKLYELEYERRRM